ncbi:MAG: hypothetical protein AB1846_09980 [Chloroflexota bacterium]
MNTLLTVVAVVLVGMVFPIVAAIIVYRKGYPGWCVATILSIPLAVGWLVGIVALTKPDKTKANANRLPQGQRAGEGHSSAIHHEENKPLPESRSLSASLPKGGGVPTKQEGRAPGTGTGTPIFLRILSLFILGLVLMVANIAIKNMKEDIATQSTAMLIVRMVLEAIFMILFLTLFLSQFPTFDRGLTKPAALSSVGLVTGFLAISFLILNRSVPRLPVFDETYWSVMQKACQGWGNDQAAEYQPGTGIHRVVSSTGGLYFLPFEWLPTSLANTELVLCLGEAESTLIQTCAYTGNQTFARYQLSRQASLVAVYSGDVIAETVFQGGPPAGCPYQISGSGSDTGPDVEEETIADWMRPFIEK